MEKGYIQVYTGNGKGKTTAALGVALRSIGNGFKVAIGQFVKSPEFQYNEVKAFSLLSAAEGFSGEIIIKQFGTGCCIHGEPTGTDKEGAARGLRQVSEWINSGNYNVVILDEINIALWLKLITIEEVIKLLTNKPEHVEIIVTGRHAPKEIIEIADLVTEMKEIKHYYNEGVIARPGIER